MKNTLFLIAWLKIDRASYSPQTQGFFDIPVDHMLPGKLICEYFQEHGIISESSMIIAPDTGSVKMSSYYARRLNIPLGIIDKKRVDDMDNFPNKDCYNP